MDHLITCNTHTNIAFIDVGDVIAHRVVAVHNDVTCTTVGTAQGSWSSLKTWARYPANVVNF